MYNEISSFVSVLVRTGMADHAVLAWALNAAAQREHLAMARQALAKAGVLSVEFMAPSVAVKFAQFEAMEGLGLTAKGILTALEYWKRVENRRNVALDAKGREFARRAGLQLERKIVHAQPRQPFVQTPKQREFRKLWAVARDINNDWPKPYFGAVPYLDVMGQMDTVSDRYGAETGKEIVVYFLSNATTWRGEKARQIKEELKAMLAAA